jgi:hypothetical protein
MQIARIGLDSVEICLRGLWGVDAHGKTVVRKTLRRHTGISVFREPVTLPLLACTLLTVRTFGRRRFLISVTMSA